MGMAFQSAGSLWKYEWWDTLFTWWGCISLLLALDLVLCDVVNTLLKFWRISLQKEFPEVQTRENIKLVNQSLPQLMFEIKYIFLSRASMSSKVVWISGDVYNLTRVGLEVKVWWIMITSNNCLSQLKSFNCTNFFRLKF